jgi:hypothetical protein
MIFFYVFQTYDCCSEYLRNIRCICLNLNNIKERRKGERQREEREREEGEDRGRKD